MDGGVGFRYLSCGGEISARNPWRTKDKGARGLSSMAKWMLPSRSELAGPGNFSPLEVRKSTTTPATPRLSLSRICTNNRIGVESGNRSSPGTRSNATADLDSLGEDRNADVMGFMVAVRA